MSAFKWYHVHKDDDDDDNDDDDYVRVSHKVNVSECMKKVITKELLKIMKWFLF